MKKVTFIGSMLLCSVMMLAACGSSKTNAQNNNSSDSPFGETYQMPCEEYDTQTEYAATGIFKGSANQKGEVQMHALNNAQEQVRMKVRHVYKGMVSNFHQNHGGNAGNDIQSKMAMAGDQAIDAVINDTRASCVRWSKVDSRGDIECYVGIRVSKEELADKIAGRVNDVLSQDEKVRIDFNEKKYRREMEQRFQNFKENN